MTIPTGFPATTTSATPTNQPVTTPDPGARTVAPTTAPSDRLVVDSSGNQIGRTFGGGTGSSTRNVIPLLLLLPLLGMAARRNNPQPLPVPMAPQGFWTQNVPLSNMYLGSSIGYGNFGGKGAISSGGSSGGYGKKVNTYGNGNVFNPTIPNVNQQFTSHVVSPNLHTQQQLFNTVMGNRNVFSSGTGGLSGAGTYVTNPVVWNNGGVSINHGLQNHAIFTRSTNTGYAPKPSNEYATPNTGFPLPSGQADYGSQHTGAYGPVQFPKPQPPIFQQPRTSWPNNNGINNNNFNPINFNPNPVNLNPVTNVGRGQVFPPNPPILQATLPSVVPPQTQRLTGSVRISRPQAPIDSAARFQINGPQRRFETETPFNSNVNSLLGNGNQGNGINQRNKWVGQNNNMGLNWNSPSSGSLQVNDWYQLLMSEEPGSRHNLRLV